MLWSSRENDGVIFRKHGWRYRVNTDSGWPREIVTRFNGAPLGTPVNPDTVG